MKIYGFNRGGLQYRTDRPATPMPSRIAFLPALSVVPLLQHQGSPAIPVVAAGDFVREGMVIGRAGTADGANVHSPVPGRVLKVVTWRMPDGRTSDALVIRLDGTFDKLGKRPDLLSWNGISPSELQRIIAEKGVVEMEEPGRPLAPLLSVSRGSNAKVLLVVNAVFDDDSLGADLTVLAERVDAVAEGALITMKAAGSTSILLVASSREFRYIEPLAKTLADRGVAAMLLPVGTKYPQRNLRELEVAVKNFCRSRTMLYDALLPFSVSTLAAVFDAVRMNVPVVERYVAVLGDAVKKPAVLRLRVGTRIGDAIEECGGFIEIPARLVVGSLLTGRAVSDLDTPITKTTNAIIAIASARVGGSTVCACIGCGNCRAVCPVQLDPERIYKLSVLGRYEEARHERSADCHGCGCCAAVCPSRLPLRASIIRIPAEKDEL